MKNRNLLFLAVFVAAALVALLARVLWFYPAPWRYSAPEVPESTFPSAAVLSDEYDAAADLEVENLLVLVDTGHSNEFNEAEMSVPLGRFTTNGADVEFVGSGLDLIQGLHQAHALIIFAPSSEFATDEIKAIQEFVDKGGRVIIFGEPTRQRNVEGLNSLANVFGVTYLNDYIYNMVENDGGFRNVIFTEFAGDVPVTDGVNEVVFQTAYSLRAVQDQAIILGDDNTFSSSSEKPGGVIAAAMAGEGRVLFMPDLTFLTSPYNTFVDNDVLLDNIVAFALTSERAYDLADFPYFFSTDVQVVYAEPTTLNNTLDDAINLRTVLTDSGLTANLAEEMDEGSGLVYLALYEDADGDILDQLEADGVTISEDPVPAPENGDDDSDLFSPTNDDEEGGSILIEGVAHLNQTNTVLIHLVSPASMGEEEEADQEDSEDAEVTEEAEEDAEESEDTEEPAEDEEAVEPAYEVILLATDEDVLVSGIDRLLNGNLQDCLITSDTAVCQGDETFDFDLDFDTDFDTPEPSGLGNFLIVADDEEYDGSDDGIGSIRVADTLEALGYSATLHSVFYDGMPTVNDLEAYDAVFWMVGENCCSAPSFDSVAVLTEYLDGGGNLFIEGGSVAFALDSDGQQDFLENYLGASYVDFGDLLDLEVGGSHPLSMGLPDVMTFAYDQISLADVIDAEGGAEIILLRGPGSSFAGDPAMVATTGDSQVIYAAFSISFLEDSDLEILLLNTIDWFSSGG